MLLQTSIFIFHYTENKTHCNAKLAQSFLKFFYVPNEKGSARDFIRFAGTDIDKPCVL